MVCQGIAHFFEAVLMRRIGGEIVHLVRIFCQVEKHFSRLRVEELTLIGSQLSISEEVTPLAVGEHLVAIVVL